MVRAIAKVLGFVCLSAFMGLIMLAGFVAYVTRNDPQYMPPTPEQMAAPAIAPANPLPSSGVLVSGPQRYTVKASWDQGESGCKPMVESSNSYFSANSTLVPSETCATFRDVYLTDKALIPPRARNVVLEPVDITR